MSDTPSPALNGADGGEPKPGWRAVSREEFRAALERAKVLRHDCNGIIDPPHHFYHDEATVRSQDWAWGKEAFAYCYDDEDWSSGKIVNRGTKYFLTTDAGLLPPEVPT